MSEEQKNVTIIHGVPIEVYPSGPQFTSIGRDYERLVDDMTDKMIQWAESNGFAELPHDAPDDCPMKGCADFMTRAQANATLQRVISHLSKKGK